MNDTKKETQLKTLMEKCRELDVDLCWDPAGKYFTALVWERPEDSLDEIRALLIQQKIERMTGQYPGLVCYCFDSFSTLVYTV